ncbi:TPA: tetratricopeptide repeat protein, partial [Candidatus Poribacteria bacterium]|nr:tetratricopeptide repeat protein [Candidatus Poribacteria bacterium]
MSHQSGQSETAITLIKQALNISPNQLNYLHNLANILKESGQFEEVVQVYRQVIQLQPGSAETYNNLGVSLHKLNQFQSAAQAYYDAIELNSEYDQAYSNLAATLIKLKQLDKAIDACLKAIEISADNFTVYCNLGNIYKEQGKFEEAIKSYQQALSIQPNIAEVHSNLGDVFKESNRLDEAIQAYQRAIDIHPNIAQVYSNMGSILYEKLVELGSGSDFHTLGVASLMEPSYLRESIQHYQQAIKIDPDCSAEIYNNLGVVLGRERELDQSAQAYQTALRINPEHAEAHYNLGTLLLLQGNFGNGWAHYEWRWKCSKFPSRKPNFLQPTWNGSNLNGKSILVWTEQGVGDQTMFASMFHSLLQMDVRIIVECPKRLISLFNRSFPISCIPKNNSASQRLLDPAIDYQSSIGSLAQWLLPDEESFPKGPSYLKACADKTGELRDEYQRLAMGKLLIGISWKSVNKDIGKPKSTSLIEWKDLLSQKDCFFINLQYGDV